MTEQIFDISAQGSAINPWMLPSGAHGIVQELKNRAKRSAPSRVARASRLRFSASRRKLIPLGGSRTHRFGPLALTDQTTMMKEDLWDPLHALVARLKNTEYRGSGSSYFDHTNIVLTSEFGRTIHGAVDDIVKKSAPEMQKQKEIDGQDISQHWKVTSAAFLGGKVKGQKQYGGIGEKTLLAIPLLPDGSMDPAYDARTGEAIPGRTPNERALTPNHGDIFATTLHLSDIDPKGKGRNDRSPLTYIKRT